MMDKLSESYVILSCPVIVWEVFGSVLFLESFRLVGFPLNLDLDQGDQMGQIFAHCFIWAVFLKSTETR
jgi:hypothetical protein